MVGRSKAEVRHQLLRTREAQEARLHVALSARVQARFLALEAVERGVDLALYAATRGEVATERVFERARACGKRVSFPQVQRAVRRLDFYAVDRWSDLAPGAFGILEPRGSAQEHVDPGSIDVIAVPGVAFDRRGHRLGYGGGYYDRLLGDRATRPRCVVGLAFDFQVLDELPRDADDAPMDWIVTESWTFAPKRTESAARERAAPVPEEA